MDSLPKVMTVSYGTFACTLEGFDDPFTTMQLVAEYFRKLAAEDRYFDGEPLQPDGDMLHRIARDANANKVDATVSDGGITLRQADIVDAPAPAKPVTTLKFASGRADPQPDESYVEAAVFTSRRAEFQPADDEPEKSAAEVLREEETEAAEPEAAVERPVVKAGVETQVGVESDVDDKSAEPEAPDAVKEYAADAREPEDTTPEEPASEAEISQIVTRAVRLQEMRQSDDIQREEEALERLLETTNSKLRTPAHARRSNALERLKAAVAATEAERRLRGKAKIARPKLQDLSGNTDAFKKEMQSVRKTHEDDMKISRPVLKRDSTKRRRTSVATLILGDNQRVDSAETPEPVEVKKKSALSHHLR